MGYYDLPAEINYITRLKQDSILYVGYSMGSTKFFVLASERPEIAKNIKAMFAFAPVAYTNDLIGPAQRVGRWIRSLKVNIIYIKNS